MTVPISHFIPRLGPISHPIKTSYDIQLCNTQSQSSQTTTDTMSNTNSSTLKSYIDSASGAAQSVLGSLTSNTADKVYPSICPDVPGFPSS